MKCKWCGNQLTAEDIKHFPRLLPPAKPVEPDECLTCIGQLEATGAKMDREFDAMERFQDQADFAAENRDHD